MIISNSGPASLALPQVNQYAAPTTGTTVTVNATTDVLLIDPAGSLLALTVNLPGTPVNGKVVTISCTQAVTTLTMGGGTLFNAIVAFAANGFVKYMFNSANSNWYRCG